MSTGMTSFAGVFPILCCLQKEIPSCSHLLERTEEALVMVGTFSGTGSLLSSMSTTPDKLVSLMCHHDFPHSTHCQLQQGGVHLVTLVVCLEQHQRTSQDLLTSCHSILHPSSLWQFSGFGCFSLIEMDGWRNLIRAEMMAPTPWVFFWGAIFGIFLGCVA